MDRDYFAKCFDFPIQEEKIENGVWNGVVYEKEDESGWFGEVFGSDFAKD